MTRHEWIAMGEPEIYNGKAVTPIRCLNCKVTAKMVVAINRYGESSKLIVHDKPFRYVRYDSCSRRRR